MHLLQQTMMMKSKGEEVNNFGGEASTELIANDGRTSSKNKVMGANKFLKTPSSSSLRLCNNNNVLIYAVTLLILLFAFSSNMNGVSASPRCGPPCPGGECPDPPHECPHGIVTNYCGKKICAKGPGQLCGTGMFKMLGTCGEGMYCNCGRCSGCSLYTMQCFDTVCIN